jgi:aspartyl-tRNA(Asn)/glutamyl-tRNA(Gln) amidotransferase subunit A
VERALAKADELQTNGAAIFTTIYRQSARLEAASSHQRHITGALLTPNDGRIISIKDLFDVAGETTLAGARALADEAPASVDAPIIAGLRRAGAVILGKTNMTQFALSCLGLNPDFGTPLSPWDRDARRIAGGSSSGAAASVAEGVVDLAIGTDTGGSIRVPAAFCGVVGFKPTAGRIDTGGTFTLSWTLDTIGPIANDVHSCAEADAILANGPAPLPPRRDGVTLGVPDGFLLDTMDAHVTVGFEAALIRLAHAGVRLVSVALPAVADLPEIGRAGGGFAPTEGWAAHANLFERVGDRCDPRVMRRFLDASHTRLSDYYTMLQIRDRIIRKCEAEDGCDAIVFPTVPIIPPRLEELDRDDAYYAANARAYRNAWVVNALGRCAITIPCGAAGGPPVGLTIMARAGADAELLSIAEGLEDAIRSDE